MRNVKRGIWKSWFCCTVCGETVRYMVPECPMCHARMEGESLAVFHPISTPPREDRQYLCQRDVLGMYRTWEVLSWRTDKNVEDGPGFYRYDHEYGDVRVDSVVYWTELPKP